MNEFYWITRLDSIDKLLVAFAVIAAIVLIVGLIGFGVTYDDDEFDSDDESIKKMRNYFKKTAVVSLIVFISVSTINTFIPSTKDAYIIYGVGGTFDYLKTNETAKQLPDKVVMAIDSYLDSKIEEQTDTVN
jgi:cytochrome bd-type quinol oxidase subunit 2